MTTVDAIGYLTVEAVRAHYPPRAVRSAKVTRITQAKPESLKRDQVAVKVTIRMPEGAFDPLEPAALIIVPEDMIQHPVEVEAIEYE